MRLVRYITRDDNRAIKFIEITMCPDFEDAIKRLRLKWGINTDLISGNLEGADKEWVLLLENNEIAADVRKLLSELNLSLSWENNVHQYLVDGSGYSYNDKGSDIVKDSDGLKLDINLEHPKGMTLHIGPATTYEDYKMAWLEIKKYRKDQPARKRARDNFLRDYKIFIMAQDGNPINKIYNTIKTEFNDDLDYGNIKKILSTFYNKIKIPKKDRTKLRTK